MKIRCNLVIISICMYIHKILEAPYAGAVLLDGCICMMSVWNFMTTLSAPYLKSL